MSTLNPLNRKKRASSNPAFFSKVIDDVMDHFLWYCRVKFAQYSDAKLPLTKADVTFLGNAAFETALRRKQTDYCMIIPRLKARLIQLAQEAPPERVAVWTRVTTSESNQIFSKILY